MSIRRLIRFARLAYFSQPPADRVLYRELRRAPAAAILEIGVGSVEQTRQLLEVVRMFRPEVAIRYAGIDLFEDRSTSHGSLSLKQMHQSLSKFPNVQIRLIPGDPFHALARSANTLSQIDLVIIRADLDEESLRKAWFYVPRMLHTPSLVFQEQRTEGKPSVFVPVKREEVQRRAEATRQSRRPAA